LTKTLWENDRISQHDADDEDWGELSLRFQGTASYYMHRKDVRARKPAVANAAAADYGRAAVADALLQPELQAQPQRPF
jgi:hypothetical protein